ncbi:SdrD B-like domain-containing protein [Streptococcus sp. ZJ93]|uniref:SpaA isopeptide-forming pilin-related protein n=1 Tax=Streptococcus handemini TaxID=3161188 RepID=UPI0034D5B805
MNKKKLFLAGLASVTLLGAAQAAYTISVSAQGTSTATGTAVSEANATIRVTDKEGKPASGVTVNLSMISGTGPVPVKAGVTNDNGVVTFDKLIAGFKYKAEAVSNDQYKAGSGAEFAAIGGVATGTPVSPLMVEKVEAAPMPKNHEVGNEKVVRPDLTELEGSSQVVIRVADNANNGVKGAEVKLFVPGADVVYKTVTTDEFGNAVFAGVIPGDYTAAVASVPAGYEANNFELPVKAVEHETTSDFITVNAVRNNSVVAENLVRPDLTELEGSSQVVVKVVDNAHEPVKGATVKLFVPGIEATYKTVTTDEFGNAVFAGVIPGEYAAAVASVPAGYEANNFELPVKAVEHETTSDFITVNKVNAESQSTTTTSTSTSSAPSSTTKPSMSTTKPSMSTTKPSMSTTKPSMSTTKPSMSTSVSSSSAVAPAAKKEEDKKVLPKTGDASSLLTVVGTVLSGLGFAGVAKRRRK